MAEVCLLRFEPTTHPSWRDAMPPGRLALAAASAAPYSLVVVTSPPQDELATSDGSHLAPGDGAVAESPRESTANPLTCTEFDFATKRRRQLDLGSVREAIGGGGFVWIDLGATDTSEAKRLLAGVIDLDGDALDEFLELPAETSVTRREDHVIVGLVGGEAGRAPEPGHVGFLMGRQVLLTAHRGAANVMAGVRARADQNFARYARSLGFMIFEIAAGVIDDHRAPLRKIEARLDALQGDLSGPTGAAALGEIADLDVVLVRMRRRMLDVRDALNELATRSSTVVSESTQPFLEAQAATMDRLANDALAAREIASTRMTLYVATASSRAGRALGRLTGITVIFLPMLFTVQVIRADLNWTSPWTALWVLAVAFAAFVVLYMRHHRLL